MLSQSAHLWRTKNEKTITIVSALYLADASCEPQPCYGEDPWLSSKGRTMGVGKAILCSQGPSSIVWSKNGPCCRTIAYFVGRKKRGGFDLIKYVSNSINLRESLGGVCLFWNLSWNLSYNLSWNLSCWKKILKKVMVSHNFCQAHLLEVGLTQILGDHETLFIISHIGLHVDCSSMKSSLNL